MTPDPMQLVDVVVISYNSARYLRRSIESLARLDAVRVIVVDNASVDGALDTIADLSAERIPLGENGGFAHACNVGWRAGTAPYVLFLNPDCVVDEASLRLLVAVLEGEPAVAVAAPKILDAAGHLDYSQRRFPRLRSTFAHAFFLNHVFGEAAWSSELVRDVRAYERTGSPEWVSGACLLVRRASLESVGGWDDGFFLYCEDKDLCRRIRDHGGGIRFEPGAVAVHVGGASVSRTSLMAVLAASRIRYARKHSGPLAARFERLGIALTGLTHMVVTRGGRPMRAGHLAELLVASGLRSPRRPDPRT